MASLSQPNVFFLSICHNFTLGLHYFLLSISTHTSQPHFSIYCYFLYYLCIFMCIFILPYLHSLFFPIPSKRQIMVRQRNTNPAPTRNGATGQRGLIRPRGPSDRHQIIEVPSQAGAAPRSRGSGSFFADFCNIRGLKSNFVSVEHHLSLSSPDLLLLSETQLSKVASPDHYQISNYNLYSRFRSKGGVCAYCNTNTPIARLIDLESPDFDALWLKISLPSITIFLCFLYFPPNSPRYVELFDYLSQCHESLLSSHPHAEVLFAGDFNVHHKDWLGSSSNDRGGAEAFSFSLLNDMEQLIKHPTRVPDRHDHSPNTLDLFFTSNPSHYAYTIFAPLGSSDHNLISIHSKWSRPPKIPPSKRLLWHFGSAQWSALREFLIDFPWDDCFLASRDASVVADSITEVILAGMEAFIPSSTKSFSSHKWFDRSCADACRIRDGAYRAKKLFPSANSHSAYISSRNRCKAIIRKVKRAFIKKKCADLSSSPTDKSFWSLAKNISNNFCTSSFPPLFRPDQSIANSPSEKAALFGSLFSSNSTLDDSVAPLPPTLPPTDPMPLPIFSSRKVYRVLSKLNVSKAYGPDGVPPCVLRECASELSPVLARLFRLCLKTQTFPSSWKHALVQPIPKKGDRSNPSNYRPIALTSSISKVFESLLNNHFLKHLETHSLLSDHQYGFRKARSTGDLLSYVTHIWATSLRDYGETYVVALDISKAFDRVWHKSLLSKLSSYGFPVSLCSLLHSYLSNRSISVIVDGSTSPSYPINSGVPQGSVLSPTLFLLFINDLLNSTSNPLNSYADDSTLHSSTHFNSAPNSLSRTLSRSILVSSLNSDLGRISDWGRSNLVKFNSTKTQFLPISLSILPTIPEIQFENAIIQPSNSIDMLGLTISSNLSWQPHIHNLARSASQKLGMLYRCRSYFTPEQLLRLYKGFIRPRLEYCSHVWGGSSSTHLLDRVESKAFRLIQSPTITSNLPSLSLRRNVASLSLFYRYYFGRCSRELLECLPPTKVWPRHSRLAASSHQFCVEVGNSRIVRSGASFFPSTAKLWNSIPASVFPSSYNLSSFKSRIYKYLRGVD